MIHQLIPPAAQLLTFLVSETSGISCEIFMCIAQIIGKTIFMPFLYRFCTVFTTLYAHFISFADVPLDETQGVIDCCVFSVDSVGAKIDKLRYGKFAVEHRKAKLFSPICTNTHTHTHSGYTKKKVAFLMSGNCINHCQKPLPKLNDSSI